MSGRILLPHEIPPNISPSPEEETFFITINCQPRGINQLARPLIWQSICETIVHRESNGDLRCKLLLAMPDHLHGLFQFPGDLGMKTLIDGIKRWLSRTQAIQWQRDFFDHRLRTPESAEEKRRYILHNPVRAGLVEEPAQWPYKRYSPLTTR